MKTEKQLSIKQPNKVHHAEDHDKNTEELKFVGKHKMRPKNNLMFHLTPSVSQAIGTEDTQMMRTV